MIGQGGAVMGLIRGREGTVRQSHHPPVNVVVH